MAKSKWPEVREKLTLVQGWARDGLFEKQIAHNLGISLDTFYRYKNEYPEFSEAIKKGKEVIDYEVENALLKRALGYRYLEETQELDYAKNEFGEQLYDLQGNPIKVPKTVKSIVKEVPPDVGAIAFWLKNRKPHAWRDRKNIELNGQITTKELPDDELNKRIAELEALEDEIEELDDLEEEEGEDE